MATSKVAQLEGLVLSLVARICTLEKTLDATVEAQILNIPDCVEKLNYCTSKTLWIPNSIMSLKDLTTLHVKCR